LGLNDLWSTLLEYAKDDGKVVAEDAPKTVKPMKIAIVGKPNAGKSTLVNHLVGEDRMLTGPEAGLTRESISSHIMWKGTPVELVDTAGLRKKAKITEHAEKISASSSINAIEEADVVVLMMDARQPFEHQDKTLAAYAVEHGKPLVLALNKWDLIENKDAILKEMKFQAEEGLSQVKDIPIVTLSAEKGQGVDKLLPPIKKVYEAWHSEIGTGELNRWLRDMIEIQPPPRRKNRALKIKYMTQIATRPPTFSMWVNMPDEVPDSYLRFLSNQLRASYNLYGIVLRFKFKGGENPYAGKRKKDEE
jgi:GTP-binding protein